MSRAYIIYFVMFAVMIGGLWLIFTVGGSLRAPDDLSGDWNLAWEGSPPAGVKDGTMRVAQSGRFFVVRFGDQADVQMVLQPGWKGSSDGRNLWMSLKGDVWKMNVSGGIPLGESEHIPEIRIVLEGPVRGVGVAHRKDAPTSRPSGVARAR